MSTPSPLYPIQNESRAALTLDGLWRFQFDPRAEGEAAGWPNGLPAPISMPVPASFSDFFTTHAERDYVGDFWYETGFFLPETFPETVCVRFGSVTHRAVVYCNGIEVARHEGGFLPFTADVTAAARRGAANQLVVKVNNELSESTLPCGAQKEMPDGRKLSKPYFDFYNYAGIHRSVWLVGTPAQAITDYSVRYELDGADALVYYTVEGGGDRPIRVSLADAEGNTVAQTEGRKGVLRVKDAHLWQVRSAYLYRIVLTAGDGYDCYEEKIGIRTVKIDGRRILINGQPVYLKGFGKHEDADIIGRGFSWAVAKRDFECMKWTGANCFRTSHYPYAEEWYQMADEEGFLIIDEVPAVGMMRSTHNFVAAGMGQYTYFFETPTVPALLANHKQQVAEMMARDKNHASVIAWSLFNEPETTSEYARKYFSEVFAYARTLDPQQRPLTGAFEKNSAPDKCRCYDLCDMICLNRYYGWYISGGPEIDEAELKFRAEMDKWAAKKLDVPFVFTEFGTDTLAAEHKLPSVMWSQEYQNEYLAMNFKVFDSYDFVQGELVWNFADFQTTEGIMRVNGNKKGVFTRQRQPKDAAFAFKRRWEALPEGCKGPKS